jgi:hypothetical protein
MRPIAKFPVATLLFFVSSVAAWAGPVITLSPFNGPAVADNGLAGNGQTLGWGLTVQNDDAGWLVFDSVQLAGDPFPVGSSAGFTDLLSLWVSDNAYAVAPNETFHLDWVLGTSGLAEFDFPSSPFGFAGPVVPIAINFDIFDANPFTDSYTSDVAADPVYVNVALAVSEPVSQSAPEPGTVALVLGASVVGWCIRGWRGQQNLLPGPHR